MIRFLAKLEFFESTHNAYPVSAIFGVDTIVPKEKVSSSLLYTQGEFYDNGSPYKSSKSFSCLFNTNRNNKS